MKDITRRRLQKRKRKIERRLARRGKRLANRNGRNRTVMSAHNIKYEVSDKSRGLVYGGIGLMRRLAERTGLVEAIDDRLHLLPLLQSEGVLCRITSRITCSTSRSMRSAKEPV